MGKQVYVLTVEDFNDPKNPGWDVVGVYRHVNDATTEAWRRMGEPDVQYPEDGETGMDDPTTWVRESETVISYEMYGHRFEVKREEVQ